MINPQKRSVFESLSAKLRLHCFRSVTQCFNVIYGSFRSQINVGRRYKKPSCR